MAYKIQLRNGTAAEWAAANPTLMQGEMAVETDTGKWKVGNGTQAWTALAYGPTGPASAWGTILGTLADQTDLNSALSGKATSAQGTLANNAVPNTRTVNAKALSSNITITPDDLDDAATTHKFVAAADITKLGNLSNTNSGDETLATIKTKLGITTLSGSNTGDQTLPTLVSLGVNATAAELNALDGITATVAELNYMDGVTSSIQTQLNAKQASGTYSTDIHSNITALNAVSGTNTGDQTLPTLVSLGVNATAGELNVLDGILATVTELNYVDGVTSAIQTQLNGKATSAQGTLADNALPKVIDGAPATHTANGLTTATFASGSTIAAMTLVYMGSASKWLVCDADAIATCGIVAISLEAKNDTQAMSVLMQGIVADASWLWTIGGAIYASGTAGQLTQTQPAGADGVIRVLGYALTATVMYFAPDMQWVTHV